MEWDLVLSNISDKQYAHTTWASSIGGESLDALQFWIFFGFMYRAVLVKQGEGEGDLWSTFILGLWAFSFSFLYIARQFKFAHRKYIIVFCQFVVLITSTFFSSSLPNVSSSIQTYKSKQTKVAPQRLQVYVCGKDNLMLSSSRNLTMP